MRSKVRSTTGVVLLVLALVAGTVACGGDDRGATTTTVAGASDRYVPPDERALLEAAKAYNEAIIDPGIDEELAATVHRHMTATCQEERSVVDVEVLLNEEIEQRRIDFGAEAEVLTVGQITVADHDASEAEVLVTLVTPTDDDAMGWGVPLSQRWWVDEGEWRIDPCAESSTIASGTEEFAPVTVIASGSHQMNGEERWATSWAAVVRNPNSDATAYDVAVTVEFLDAEGEVVATADEVIIDIEPGTSGAVAGTIDAPGTTTLSVRARAGSWLPGEEVYLLEGAVTGTEVEPPLSANMTPQTRIDGTITNRSDVDLGAIPVVVLVDATGRVRGGVSDVFMVDGVVTPGGTIEFQTSAPEAVPADWQYRVYVTPAAPDYTDYRQEWQDILTEQ